MCRSVFPPSAEHRGARADVHVLRTVGAGVSVAALLVVEEVPHHTAAGQ